MKGQCKTQFENAVRQRTLKNTQKSTKLEFFDLAPMSTFLPSKKGAKFSNFYPKKLQIFLFLPKKSPNLPISTQKGTKSSYFCPKRCQNFQILPKKAPNLLISTQKGAKSSDFYPKRRQIFLFLPKKVPNLPISTQKDLKSSYFYPKRRHIFLFLPKKVPNIISLFFFLMLKRHYFLKFEARTKKKGI